MSDYPTVSIIIANWNGGDVFKSCLVSLSKITYPNWQLIVADNGSSDQSEKLPAKILKHKKKFLIKNTRNLGFSTANNQGVKKSSGKYILLLNNDTQVTNNFLEIMIKKMEDDRTIGVLQPKIILMDKPGYLDNTGSLFTKIGFLHHLGFLEKNNKKYNKEREVFSVKGACMLIRKDLIKKIGLFDKDFFSYFEESDFCWRVWLAGFKVVYYPKAHIYHKVGFTIKRLDVLDINYHYYKNRICSLIKNLEFKNILSIVSIHLFISLGLVLIFFVRGKLKNSLMIIEAIIWNVQNLNKTLSKRKRIQKIRVIDDNFIFDKLSISVNWGEFYKDFKRVEKDIKD